MREVTAGERGPPNSRGGQTTTLKPNNRAEQRESAVGKRPHYTEPAPLPKVRNGRCQPLLIMQTRGKPLLKHCNLYPHIASLYLKKKKKKARKQNKKNTNKPRGL